MDRHPLDRPLSSDKSFEVYQRRAGRAELRLDLTDSTLCRFDPLVHVPGARQFIADPDFGQPELSETRKRGRG